MPRPPILPTLNWSDIWQGAMDFSTWLSKAEDPAVAATIAQQVTDQVIPPAQRGIREPYADSLRLLHSRRLVRCSPSRATS